MELLEICVIPPRGWLPELSKANIFLEVGIGLS